MSVETLPADPNRIPGADHPVPQLQGISLLASLGLIIFVGPSLWRFVARYSRLEESPLRD